jgi:rRNA maturation protein Rpf1
MKEYLLDQYEEKITPEIDDLIKIREESSMPKWIVITEVESEVDPAVFNYVNGTTLISSLLKEASKCACNECECVIKDDYTKEGGTCEECFRECVSTEGGE